MKAKLITQLASACAVLGLDGCTLGPDFHAPSTPLGAHWQQPDASTTRSRAVPGDVDSQWWRSFGDPQLTALLAEAQANNLDLRVAASHVEQSLAARATVSADRLPSIDATGDYSRARGSERGLSDISGNNGKDNYNVWNTGLNLAWEADLWGRVRRSVEAADAKVQVSVEEQHAAMVSIMAQVARDYIELRGTQSSLEVTRKNLDIARHSLDLTRARLAQGVATDLEVAQAAALRASIEARVPALEQQRSVLINALSFLVGRQPGALSAELSPSKAIPAGPANVPVGLPSELAQRRPDIRRAEADLHAATAAIGIAKADFYPRISLSGNAGFQAMQLSNLGSWGSHTFAFGPSLSVPIFEGGRLRGQLQLRESAQREAGIAYQRTVLAAWHEVDNALSGYQADQRRHQSLELAVTESQRALASAQQQYAQGSVDFLNVLTVQNALLANQAALVHSTADVSLTLVTLYQALGGGWQQPAQAALAGDGRQR
ncbi:efflux transporter outer membrane subunit [Pseudomonas sp. MWU16-30317]|uniref:efflux transporter outer membrane subunit n=1 Tax=Pseudomonas sp. MWU16-30317 TaxID=2878095 RepID=UPI001CFC0D99|nr:efflux transporter outer membrane subunit [Pseudomonas sp. MWU16-30317]